MIRDSYVLAYDWDGDAAVRWQLAEAGSMVTEMSGAYLLAEDGTGTERQLRAVRRHQAADDRDAQAPAEKTIIETALKGLKSRARSRRRAQGSG